MRYIVKVSKTNEVVYDGPNLSEAKRIMCECAQNGGVTFESMEDPPAKGPNKFSIVFEEEYDYEAFINMLHWHTDKNNWKEDDCIHIVSWHTE